MATLEFLTASVENFPLSSYCSFPPVAFSLSYILIYPQARGDFYEGEGLLLSCSLLFRFQKTSVMKTQSGQTPSYANA